MEAIVSDNLMTGTIQEIEKQAETILVAVAPDAWCQAQEWDNRIDCCIKLSDGKVIGEMVSLTRVTEARIRQAGERLQKRKSGIEVTLHNELWPPIVITRSKSN
jgi:hypothetical protein